MIGLPKKIWVEILVCQAVVNVSSESFSLLFKRMEMKDRTEQEELPELHQDQNERAKEEIQAKLLNQHNPAAGGESLRDRKSVV